MNAHVSHIPIAGVHALKAVLDECPEVLLEIWVCNHTNQKRDQLLTQAADLGIAISRVKPQTIAAITPSHRGILGWCRPPVIHNLNWLETNVDQGLLLALDRVTDAHNFGACLRSAEAASTAAVLVSEHNAAGLSAGAAKSSSGALFRIPLVSCPSLPQAVANLTKSGWSSAALSERANQSLYSLAPVAKQLLVVGNEQTGVSSRVAALCQQHISIPTSGRNASLNVAVATGAAVLWLANLRQ